MHFVTFIGHHKELDLMTLEQFTEQLRSVMKNPNAIALRDNTIYVFTNDCELIAFTVSILA